MHKQKLQRIKNTVLRSMRFKIILIALIIGCIPVLIFRIGIFMNYEDRMIQNRKQRLQTQCNILRNHLVSENYLVKQDSPMIAAELTQLSALYDGRIMIINQDYRIIKDTYIMDEGKLSISPYVLQCMENMNTDIYHKQKNYLQYTFSIPSQDSQSIAGVLVVTFSIRDIYDQAKELKRRALVLIIFLFLLVVSIAVWVAAYLVAPFKKMEHSVERIAVGNFEDRLQVMDYIETEKISNAFNHMLDRYHKLDDSRQEFVSNVSHELKTPITSMKVLADSLISQEDVPVELYREFMEDIVEEIDRENKVITDLLTLVKTDQTTAQLNVSQVSINELIEVILKRIRPIAQKRNIELVLESFRPVVAWVDEVKLSIAISNLVENAVKYNIIDGWVRVTLNADHKYFYIKVADCGAGIPKEEQDSVFERFYRVDKTRSRETGGNGLGLSITKNIITMHDGLIKLYSKEGEGTTFTVRIPLDYINKQEGLVIG